MNNNAIMVFVWMGCILIAIGIVLTCLIFKMLNILDMIKDYLFFIRDYVSDLKVTVNCMNRQNSYIFEHVKTIGNIMSKHSDPNEIKKDHISQILTLYSYDEIKGAFDKKEVKDGKNDEDC